jgi:hypothetical protein
MNSERTCGLLRAALVTAVCSLVACTEANAPKDGLPKLRELTDSHGRPAETKVSGSHQPAGANRLGVSAASSLPRLSV